MDLPALRRELRQGALARLHAGERSAALVIEAVSVRVFIKRERNIIELRPKKK